MKTLTLVLSLAWFVSFSTEAVAQLSDLAGRWKNVKPATRSITKVEIGVAGVSVSVQLFGACSPTDCDLGTVSAIAYASAVDADLALKASALTAQYDFGFSDVRVVIHRVGRHRIKLETFTHFKDGSGRTDYHATETMRRLRPGETF